MHVVRYHGIYKPALFAGYLSPLLVLLKFLISFWFISCISYIFLLCIKLIKLIVLPNKLGKGLIFYIWISGGCSEPPACHSSSARGLQCSLQCLHHQLFASGCSLCFLGSPENAAAASGSSGRLCLAIISQETCGPFWSGSNGLVVLMERLWLVK